MHGKRSWGKGFIAGEVAGKISRRKPMGKETMWFRSNVFELDLGLFLLVGCWIPVGFADLPYPAEERKE